METANSLSGGKTSGFMAVHYPADHELFALVCIDDHNARRKIDKKLKQMANDKLQKYCSHHKEFVATSEDPIILQTMFDLEQIIGKEVTWLRGIGWEEMIRIKSILPNKHRRFCTTILKMVPIFEFLFKYSQLPIKMRLGYRYDEMERKENASDHFRYSDRCEYREKSNTWIHRWQDLLWRINEFPLIDDKIIHPTVVKFWEDKPIVFPKDSNCQNCFWKDPQQLRKNFDENPDIMFWAMIFEEMYDSSFHDYIRLIDIRNIGLQYDFDFGTGSGCKAGGCHD